MSKLKRKKSKKLSNTDKNLALISVILGATSFIFLFFTGLPAIITGIIALKSGVGDRTQAILGIVFGTIGSLIIIPIIALMLHFARPYIAQQTSVSAQDYNAIQDLSKGLQNYRASHGALPFCQDSDTQATCSDWQAFLSEYQKNIPYPINFEPGSSDIENRPVGTLVYAAATTCFLSTPVSPDSVNSDDHLSQQELRQYSALVYFHSGGRACYPIRP